MARLIVEAVAAESPSVGSTKSALIVVSVTDDAGNPVAGLGSGSFKISDASSNQSAVFKGVVNDLNVTSSGSTPQGFYLAEIDPFGNSTWLAGVHVVTIAVTRTRLGKPMVFEGKELPSSIAFDHGQTVTRLVIGP
jgi:hypothetical protein